MRRNVVGDVILILFGICMCVNSFWFLIKLEISDAFRIAGTSLPRFGLNTACLPRKSGFDGHL